VTWCSGDKTNKHNFFIQYWEGRQTNENDAMCVQDRQQTWNNLQKRFLADKYNTMEHQANIKSQHEKDVEQYKKAVATYLQSFHAAFSFAK
jgi:hypothetical protein